MIWDLVKVGVVFAAVGFWVYCSRESENKLMKNVITKYILYAEGILTMITSKDTKKLGPKYNPDPDLLTQAPNAVMTTKTVVFMRHGESDWNDIFNKGFGPSMGVRLIKGFIRETMMLITMDSVFLDSGLNEDGFNQAKELDAFLVARAKNTDAADSASLKNLYNAINGTGEMTSVVVASNLRRAIATTTMALWTRLTRTKEKIHVLSNLQEISRNIDTKALAARGTVPDLHVIGQHCENFDPLALYDVSENLGNKTSYFNGVKRLKAFNDWAFKRPEDCVIVGGHSLWFKHYFQMYLPHSSDHPGKTKKIENTGMVAMQVQRWTDSTSGAVLGYRVDPATIEVVYRGFMTKNK